MNWLHIGWCRWKNLQTRKRAGRDRVKSRDASHYSRYLIALLMVGVLALYAWQEFMPGESASSPAFSMSPEKVDFFDEQSSYGVFSLILGQGIPGMEASYPDELSPKRIAIKAANYLTGLNPQQPADLLAAGIAGFLPEQAHSSASQMQKINSAGEEGEVGEKVDEKQDANLDENGSSKKTITDAPLANRGDRDHGSLEGHNGSDSRAGMPAGEDSVILIYHNHITEAFYPTSGENFITDLDYTVAELGRQLATMLKDDYDIPVKHNTEIFDIPRRTAYRKARPKISEVIDNNPEIGMVVDIHRDGISRQTTTANIDEEDMGKFLLVVGTGHEQWRDNFSFALLLQQQIEEINPAISRGIRPQNFVYNQDLHERAALIEVGGHLNTLKEAQRSMPILAEALAETYYQLLE